MVKQNVETRGLPGHLYMNASLLKAVRLAAKAMNQDPESIIATAIQCGKGHGKEDLDRMVRSVEKMYSRGWTKDGKWSDPLKKSARVQLPTTVLTPGYLKRKAISEKDSDVRVLDALVCRQLAFTRSKLPWREKTKQDGTFSHYYWACDDSQSPNNHLVVFTVDTTEYHILLKGVARASRKMRKKKVGKTQAVEESKDTKTVSFEGVDLPVKESSASSKLQRIMRESEVEVSSLTSSASAGYQMGT